MIIKGRFALWFVKPSGRTFNDGGFLGGGGFQPSKREQNEYSGVDHKSGHSLILLLWNGLLLEFRKDGGKNWLEEFLTDWVEVQYFNKGIGLLRLQLYLIDFEVQLLLWYIWECLKTWLRSFESQIESTCLQNEFQKLDLKLDSVLLNACYIEWTNF